MPDGEVVECRIRGRLRLEGLKTTNPIAVGDIVILDPKSDEEGKRVIVDYELRENYIVRKSTNLSKQMHILAANIGLFNGDVEISGNTFCFYRSVFSCRRIVPHPDKHHF